MKSIVIDTSALIAVIANEPEKRRLATLLDKADRGERIRIRRKDGHLFDLLAVPDTGSPLEIEGVALGVSTEEIFDIVRENRTRYDLVP